MSVKINATKLCSWFGFNEFSNNIFLSAIPAIEAIYASVRIGASQIAREHAHALAFAVDPLFHCIAALLTKKTHVAFGMHTKKTL